MRQASGRPRPDDMSALVHTCPGDIPARQVGTFSSHDNLPVLRPRCPPCLASSDRSQPQRSPSSCWPRRGRDLGPRRQPRAGRRPRASVTGGLMGVVGALSFGLPGAWLARQRPGHVIGWIFLAMGTCAALSLAATEYGPVGPLVGGRSGAGGQPVARQLAVGGRPGAGRSRWFPSCCPTVCPLNPRWRPAVGNRHRLGAGGRGLPSPCSRTPPGTPALADAGLVNPVGAAVPRRPRSARSC